MTEEAKEVKEEKIETQAESAEKLEEQAKTVDDTMDEILDQELGKDKPFSPTSGDKETTEEEAEKAKEGDLEAGQTKKATDEGKEAEKSEEEEIPKEFHKHPKWQKLLDRAKAAEEKLVEQEKSGGLTEEQSKALDDVKLITSSKEFLKDKLEKEGFTEDAINTKLAEAGFDSKPKVSDIEVAAKALGVDVENLSKEDKADISNLVKISDGLLMNRLQEILPGIINPLSEKVAGLTRKETGMAIHNDFTKQVETDGVLNYEKDLAPDIVKYLDDNPKAMQEDVEKFQKELYHDKLVKFKGAKAKKVERDDKVEGNRTGDEGSKTRTGLPDKTGDFNKDADALFDHMGVQ